MTVPARDILFYGGGVAIAQYGTPWRRVRSAFVGGDQALPTHVGFDNGYMATRAGVLVQADSVLRVDWWNEFTTPAPALCVERGTTNDFTAPQDYSNVAWNKDACSVAQNRTGPDGAANSAWTITEDATSNAHGLRQVGPSETAGQLYTATFYVERGDQNWCYIQLSHLGFILRQWFQLTGNGTVGSATGGTPYLATIRHLTGNWYRVSVTIENTGGGGPAKSIFAADADSSTSYLGDNSDPCYVWAASFENRPAPSWFVATTHVDENMTFPFPHGPQLMTVYALWIETGEGADGNVGGAIFGRIYQIGDGGLGSADTFRLHATASGGYTASYHDGTTAFGAAINDATITYGDRMESLITFFADGHVDHELFRNGTSLGSATSATPSTAPVTFGSEELFLGMGKTTTFGNRLHSSAILAVIIARSSHTRAEMRELVPSTFLP